MYLVEGDDLAIGLLDLPQLGEEVPEPRLGDNLVGCEDAHAEKLGYRVGLGRHVAADDLVFLKTTCGRGVSRLSLCIRSIRFHELDANCAMNISFGISTRKSSPNSPQDSS